MSFLISIRRDSNGNTFTNLSIEEPYIPEVIAEVVPEDLHISSSSDKTEEPQKERRKGNRCGHGKRSCKECGIGCCEHQRNKYKCKECGTGICIHSNWKFACKECGIGYCEHERRKYRCKECMIDKRGTKGIKRSRDNL